MMEVVGSALPSVLIAAVSLPCLLLAVVLGEAGLRVAALALRSAGGGGESWRPTCSAFLGYRIACPGPGGNGFSSSSQYSSAFREDDEPPLPRECCDRLAVALYRRGDHHGQPEAECAFCLSAVRDGDEVRELRCRHVFHRACLDAWLVRPRATCPLCRDRLLPSEESPRACTAGDLYYLVHDDDLDLPSLSSPPPPPRPTPTASRSGT